MNDSQLTDAHYVFKGEAQLAGWSDTHTGGAKVTLWLPDSTDLEAFRSMTVRKGNTAGQVMMVAMVEVSDDGTPVRQPAKPQALSTVAAGLCRDPMFWAWWGEAISGVEPRSEAECAELMRYELGIRSRAELDTSNEKAQAFHDNIRRPFVAWRG